MPETYNPRERTFIKMPEVRTCPACGQTLPSDVKPMTNHMNAYMHPVTLHVNIVNSNEPTVVMKGEIFYRCRKNERNQYVMENPPSAPVSVSENKQQTETGPAAPVKSKLQAAQTVS